MKTIVMVCAADIQPRASRGRPLDVETFFYHQPSGKIIHRITRHVWRIGGVDRYVRPIKTGDVYVKASQWIKENQMVYTGRVTKGVHIGELESNRLVDQVHGEVRSDKLSLKVIIQQIKSNNYTNRPSPDDFVLIGRTESFVYRPTKEMCTRDVVDFVCLPVWVLPNE
jgi:hypothetical protein